jgi:hypothetical protein
MATFTSVSWIIYNIYLLIPQNFATWSSKVEMLLICFNLWNVVNKNEVNIGPSDPTIQFTWKSKDFKTCANIHFHCGQKKIL